MLAGQVLHLEPWHPHLHAQRLDLVAARNSATVVVRKNDNRCVFQTGLENAFAGDVEVIDVHQRKLRRGRHGHPREL